MSNHTINKNSSLFIISITFFYIIAEIILNIKLLEVFGTWSVTKEEIKDIEHIGRTISGIGLGILTWKILNKKFFKSLFFIFPFMIVGVIVMFHAQEALINHLVEKSTAEERRLSYSMTAIAKSLAKNKVELTDITIKEEDIGNSAVKALIAILPSVGILNPRMINQIKDKSVAIAENYALSVMPSLDATCDTLITVNNNIADAYDNEYKDGSEKVQRYQSERARDKFRQKMIDYGIMNPPPPGLSWTSFSRHPSIVKFAKEKITKEGVSEEFLNNFKLNMDCPQIKREIYDPKLKEIKDKIQKKILSKASEFEPGGTMYEDGLDGYRMAVVPPIALITSAFFGALNLAMFMAIFIAPISMLFVTIFKTAFPNTLLENIKTPCFLKLLIKPTINLFIIMVIIVLPMKKNNFITDSVAFKGIESSAKAEGIVSAVTVYSLHWLINAQPAISSIPIPTQLRDVMFENYRVCRKWVWYNQYCLKNITTDLECQKYLEKII